MIQLTRRIAILLLVMLFSLSISFVAFAKDYPNKPIRIIIPWSVGGASDTILRTIQPFFSKSLGVPVSVENKTGGAGMVGTAYFVRQPADGYTLLFQQADAIALAQYLTKNPGFNFEDLAPLTQLAIDGRYAFVRKDSPYKSMDDLIRDARKRPGKVTIGHSAGTGAHFLLQWMVKKLDLPIKMVGFQGGGTAQTALLGGHIDCFQDAGSGRLGIKDKVRSIGLSLSEKNPMWPNAVPFIEQEEFKKAGVTNIPGVETAVLMAFWVRSEVKEKYPERYYHLVSAMYKTKKNKELEEKIVKLGKQHIMVWNTPDKMSATIESAESVYRNNMDIIKMIQE